MSYAKGVALTYQPIATPVIPFSKRWSLMVSSRLGWGCTDCLLTMKVASCLHAGLIVIAELSPTMEMESPLESLSWWHGTGTGDGGLVLTRIV
eukprot:scaffold4489_cov26-Tisochrysis_lutea.AAC.1